MGSVTIRGHEPVGGWVVDDVVSGTATNSDALMPWTSPFDASWSGVVIVALTLPSVEEVLDGLTRVA